MAIPKGLWDEAAENLGWLDVTADSSGWFDRDGLNVSAAGGPVTATLTQTEQNDTLTSLSVLSILANLTATEANDSLSGAAVLSIQASLTGTEANDSSSSSSVLSIQASPAVTEANDSLASTASLSIIAIVSTDVISNFSLGQWRKWARKVEEDEEFDDVDLPVELKEIAIEAVKESISAPLIKDERKHLLKAMEAWETYNEVYKEAYKEAYVAESVKQRWLDDRRKEKRNRAIVMLLLH